MWLWSVLKLLWSVPRINKMKVRSSPLCSCLRCLFYNLFSPASWHMIEMVDWSFLWSTLTRKAMELDQMLYRDAFVRAVIRRSGEFVACVSFCACGDQKIRWVCWLFTEASYSQNQAKSSWESLYLTKPNKLYNIWRRLKAPALFSKKLATCKPGAEMLNTCMCRLILLSFVPIGVTPFLLALYYLHWYYISNSL